MAVTAVHLARVTQTLRSFNLLEGIRRSQTSLYRVQNNLSTGLRFLRPSEDPIGATAAGDLNRRLSWLEQVQTNLRQVNNTLTEIDTAMQEAMDLISQAQTIAVQSVGDSISPEERQALVPIVDSIIDRLIEVGNRRYLNTYLFSGHASGAPFARDLGGVVYRGDEGRMEAVVDVDLTADYFTVSGQAFFAAVSSEIRGLVDLDPALTAQTRIRDLNGAAGRGVQLGRIVVSTPTTQVQIDLTGADTLGDLVDRLNAELPDGLKASLGTRGICLARTSPTGGEITISESGAGRTATDLGLLGSFSNPRWEGQDLDPRLTPLTRIADLRAGNGLNLRGGLIIRNGDQTATIRLDDAETIEDLLNRINQAGVGAWARISADGARLEVLNRTSGTDLQIEDNGGLAATALGLRNMQADTLLADLNDGAGVGTVTGDDLQITTADGTVITVDLDGARTLQDVLDRLNLAGNGAITASLATTGNGLVITDNTLGTQTLRIDALNDSPALADLGLNVSAVRNQIIGQNVRPVRVNSPFTALLELRDGMLASDRLTLTRAGQRLDDVVKIMHRIQGQVASQARVMEDRTTRVETEILATKSLLSDVQDVDFADAAVRFQQLQTALQATLSTAAQVLNLSVLDYLR